MKQPTKQEWQEVLEWCGFEEHFEFDTGAGYWQAPDGKSDPDLPPLDSNNLFKYTVPFLNKHYGYALCLEQTPGSFKWSALLVRPNCSIAYIVRDQDSEIDAVYKVVRKLMDMP